MIVCSLPRCGATRFCLDLQESSGLPFVGEMHPIHIDNSRKAAVHETKFQTNYTPEMFADLLHDHTKHIVLVNQHPYLLLPQADVVLLRKNMNNAFLSLANFLLIMYPGIKAHSILHQLRVARNDWLGMRSYLDKYPRDIVWYEEYFGDLKTFTPELNSFIHRDIIFRELDSYHDT